MTISAMSEVEPTVSAMHHPWRAFRTLTEWTLRWADLPDGLFGLTDHQTRVVTLSTGLGQAQRRCTIAHEHEHIADPDATETEVRQRTARRLITFDQLADAMVWAGNEGELARELWVDIEVARDRLLGLTAGESADLVRRLDAAELRNP